MNKSGVVSVLQILVHIIFLRPFLKLFSGVNAVGRENIRYLDRYIIIANHNSHLDICLLFSVIPIKDIPRTHAVAAKEYFSASPFVFRLVRFFFNTIFISRGQHRSKMDPLEEMRAKLTTHHNVIIFPEGTRGVPGELQRFKSGIGRLVADFPEIPIVPVFISGTERGLPKSKVLLLPFWNNLIIGPPKLCTGKHRDITNSLERTLEELSASELAQRHKRPKAKAPPTSIAFLGIDGSGKSTISKMIAIEMSVSSSVCRISDGMDFFRNGEEKGIQPLITEKIRETINNYAKKAGSLKMYKTPKLAELLLRNHLQHEAGRWYLPDLIIMDGSPLLNIIAWASLYKEGLLDQDTCMKAIQILSGKDGNIPKDDPIIAQFPELLSLKRLKLNKFMLPDIVIFLDTPPTVACERISARGEYRQVHETEEKLVLLRKAYLMVCKVVRQKMSVPVLIINGQDSLDSITQTALKFVRDCVGQEVENNGNPC